MKPCRTKYKKAINKYKYDRVVSSPLSKHCKVRVSCYNDILHGWLLGNYLFVAIPESDCWNGKLQDEMNRLLGKLDLILFSNYFRYYVGDNIRTDHVMYYETGLDYRF